MQPRAGTRHAEPLTKPEAQRVQRAAAALDAFQDEKLLIYNQQHDQMSEAFDKARQVREHLASEYSARNQMILDRLTSMKTDIDKDSRRHMERLKELSAELEGSIEGGKAAWRKNMQREQDKVMTLGGRMNEELTRLDTCIKAEREDCKTHAESETGPINEKLHEHRGNLDRQVMERERQHKEYCFALQDHFDRLRARLKAEGEAREKQWTESRADIQAGYAELTSAQREQEASQMQELDLLRHHVQQEREERRMHHESASQDVTDFMSKFESNLGKNKEWQKSNQSRTAALKASIKFE